MKKVSGYLVSLIAKQVDDNGVVVWYDPDCAYSGIAEALELPNTTVCRYDESLVRLRWEIDQKKLLDGEEAPRLVVYVPMSQDAAQHALIELEAMGVVMQPGQQPPARNTRLAVVARNALKDTLGDETVAQLARQAEEGRVTLADLDALAEKGAEVGALALVFGTGGPQEIILAFLASDQLDTTISSKNACGELVELVRKAFGMDIPDSVELDDLRQRVSRFVLMTELVSSLGESVPPQLASVPVASTPATEEACKALARSWRLRRDTRQSYVDTAQRVEKQFALGSIPFDPPSVFEIDTFSAIERTILLHAESRLLKSADPEVLSIADSRLSRFWCDVEPHLQARWALVACAARVLLESDRVEEEFKKAPPTVAGLVREYAVSDRPWCMLDTHHRHLESLWTNFESHGDDQDVIDRLVIKARQRYAEVGSLVARHFLTQFTEETSGKNVARQRDVYEKHVKPYLEKQKTAYVWVDALRFEMGRETAQLLRGDFEIELQAALATAPTLTEIGMPSLLPKADGPITIVVAGVGKLALEMDGTVIKDRKDRVAFLKKHAGVEVFDMSLDSLLPKPQKKARESIAKAQLILVTSQEIDDLCERDNITQARRQMDGVLNDLRRGIRVLADLGVERVVLTADHGHLFAEPLSEDMKVDPPGGETVDLHRRVWIGHGGKVDDAYLRMPLGALDVGGGFDMATPWTFAAFKCKGGAKAYFHGGLSLQELLVPVMVLRPLVKTSSRPPVGIEWRLSPGSQKITSRFFSVGIEGVNKGLFSIEPPKVRVELRAKGKTVSRTFRASYGFDEASEDVALRSNEADPKSIEPNTVTLQILGEPATKSVSVHLLDAATGIELSQLEKIELALPE